MSLEWKGVGPEADAFCEDVNTDLHGATFLEELLPALLERAIAFGMVMGVRSVGIANLAKEQGLTPITGGEPDCGNDWCDDPRTGPCAACAEKERVQSTIEDDAAPSGELMR